jgi:hypothetical protein
MCDLVSRPVPAAVVTCRMSVCHRPVDVDLIEAANQELRRRARGEER